MTAKDYEVTIAQEGYFVVRWYHRGDFKIVVCRGPSELAAFFEGRLANG